MKPGGLCSPSDGSNAPSGDGISDVSAACKASEGGGGGGQFPTASSSESSSACLTPDLCDDRHQGAKASSNAIANGFVCDSMANGLCQALFNNSDKDVDIPRHVLSPPSSEDGEERTSSACASRVNITQKSSGSSALYQGRCTATERLSSRSHPLGVSKLAAPSMHGHSSGHEEVMPKDKDRIPSHSAPQSTLKNVKSTKYRRKCSLEELVSKLHSRTDHLASGSTNILNIFSRSNPPKTAASLNSSESEVGEEHSSSCKSDGSQSLVCDKPNTAIVDARLSEELPSDGVKKKSDSVLVVESCSERSIGESPCISSSSKDGNKPDTSEKSEILPNQSVVTEECLDNPLSLCSNSKCDDSVKVLENEASLSERSLCADRTDVNSCVLSATSVESLSKDAQDEAVLTDANKLEIGDKPTGMDAKIESRQPPDTHLPIPDSCRSIEQVSEAAAVDDPKEVIALSTPKDISAPNSVIDLVDNDTKDSGSDVEIVFEKKRDVGASSLVTSFDGSSTGHLENFNSPAALDSRRGSAQYLEPISDDENSLLCAPSTPSEISSASGFPSNSDTPMFSDTPSDASRGAIMVKISDAVAAILSDVSDDSLPASPSESKANQNSFANLLPRLKEKENKLPSSHASTTETVASSETTENCSSSQAHRETPSNSDNAGDLTLDQSQNRFDKVDDESKVERCTTSDDAIGHPDEKVSSDASVSQSSLAVVSDCQESCTVSTDRAELNAGSLLDSGGDAKESNKNESESVLEALHNQKGEESSLSACLCKKSSESYIGASRSDSKCSCLGLSSMVESATQGSPNHLSMHITSSLSIESCSSNLACQKPTSGTLCTSSQPNNCSEIGSEHLQDTEQLNTHAESALGTHRDQSVMNRSEEASCNDTDDNSKDMKSLPVSECKNTDITNFSSEGELQHIQLIESSRLPSCTKVVSSAKEAHLPEDGRHSELASSVSNSSSNKLASSGREISISVLSDECESSVSCQSTDDLKHVPAGSIIPASIDVAILDEGHSLSDNTFCEGKSHFNSSLSFPDPIPPSQAKSAVTEEGSDINLRHIPSHQSLPTPVLDERKPTSDNRFSDDLLPKAFNTDHCSHLDVSESLHISKDPSLQQSSLQVHSHVSEDPSTQQTLPNVTESNADSVIQPLEYSKTLVKIPSVAPSVPEDNRDSVEESVEIKSSAQCISSEKLTRSDHAHIDNSSVNKAAEICSKSSQDLFITKDNMEPVVSTTLSTSKLTEMSSNSVLTPKPTKFNETRPLKSLVRSGSSDSPPRPRTSRPKLIRRNIPTTTVAPATEPVESSKPELTTVLAEAKYGKSIKLSGMLALPSVSESSVKTHRAELLNSDGTPEVASAEDSSEVDKTKDSSKVTRANDSGEESAKDSDKVSEIKALVGDCRNAEGKSSVVDCDAVRSSPKTQKSEISVAIIPNMPNKPAVSHEVQDSVLFKAVEETLPTEPNISPFKATDSHCKISDIVPQRFESTESPNVGLLQALTDNTLTKVVTEVPERKELVSGETTEINITRMLNINSRVEGKKEDAPAAKTGICVSETFNVNTEVKEREESHSAEEKAEHFIDKTSEKNVFEKQSVDTKASDGDRYSSIKETLETFEEGMTERITEVVIDKRTELIETESVKTSVEVSADEKKDEVTNQMPFRDMTRLPESQCAAKLEQCVGCDLEAPTNSHVPCEAEVEKTAGTVCEATSASPTVFSKTTGEAGVEAVDATVEMSSCATLPSGVQSKAEIEKESDSTVFEMLKIYPNKSEMTLETGESESNFKTLSETSVSERCSDSSRIRLEAIASETPEIAPSGTLSESVYETEVNKEMPVSSVDGEIEVADQSDATKSEIDSEISLGRSRSDVDNSQVSNFSTEISEVTNVVEESNDHQVSSYPNVTSDSNSSALSGTMEKLTDVQSEENVDRGLVAYDSTSTGIQPNGNDTPIRLDPLTTRYPVQSNSSVSISPLTDAVETQMVVESSTTPVAIESQSSKVTDFETCSKPTSDLPEIKPHDSAVIETPDQLNVLIMSGSSIFEGKDTGTINCDMEEPSYGLVASCVGDKTLVETDLNQTAETESLELTDPQSTKADLDITFAKAGESDEVVKVEEAWKCDAPQTMPNLEAAEAHKISSTNIEDNACEHPLSDTEHAHLEKDGAGASDREMSVDGSCEASSYQAPNLPNEMCDSLPSTNMVNSRFVSGISVDSSNMPPNPENSELHPADPDIHPDSKTSATNDDMHASSVNNLETPSNPDNDVCKTPVSNENIVESRIAFENESAQTRIDENSIEIAASSYSANEIQLPHETDLQRSSSGCLEAAETRLEKSEAVSSEKGEECSVTVEDACVKVNANYSDDQNYIVPPSDEVSGNQKLFPSDVSTVQQLPDASNLSETNESYQASGLSCEQLHQKDNSESCVQLDEENNSELESRIPKESNQTNQLLACTISAKSVDHSTNETHQDNHTSTDTCSAKEDRQLLLSYDVQKVENDDDKISYDNTSASLSCKSSSNDGLVKDVENLLLRKSEELESIQASSSPDPCAITETLSALERSPTEDASRVDVSDSDKSVQLDFRNELASSEVSQEGSEVPREELVELQPQNPPLHSEEPGEAQVQSHPLVSEEPIENIPVTCSKASDESLQTATDFSDGNVMTLEKVNDVDNSVTSCETDQKYPGSLPRGENVPTVSSSCVQSPYFTTCQSVEPKNDQSVIVNMEPKNYQSGIVNEFGSASSVSPEENEGPIFHKPVADPSENLQFSFHSTSELARCNSDSDFQNTAPKDEEHSFRNDIPKPFETVCQGTVQSSSDNQQTCDPCVAGGSQSVDIQAAESNRNVVDEAPVDVAKTDAHQPTCSELDKASVTDEISRQISDYPLPYDSKNVNNELSESTVNFENSEQKNLSDAVAMPSMVGDDENCPVKMQDFGHLDNSVSNSQENVTSESASGGEIEQFEIREPDLFPDNTNATTDSIIPCATSEKTSLEPSSIILESSQNLLPLNHVACSDPQPPSISDSIVCIYPTGSEVPPNEVMPKDSTNERDFTTQDDVFTGSSTIPDLPVSVSDSLQSLDSHVTLENQSLACTERPTENLDVATSSVKCFSEADIFPSLPGKDHASKVPSASAEDQDSLDRSSVSLNDGHQGHECPSTAAEEGQTSQEFSSEAVVEGIKNLQDTSASIIEGHQALVASSTDIFDKQALQEDPIASSSNSQQHMEGPATSVSESQTPTLVPASESECQTSCAAPSVSEYQPPPEDFATPDVVSQHYRTDVSTSVKENQAPEDTTMSVIDAQPSLEGSVPSNCDDQTTQEDLATSGEGQHSATSVIEFQQIPEHSATDDSQNQINPENPRASLNEGSSVHVDMSMIDRQHPEHTSDATQNVIEESNLTDNLHTSPLHVDTSSTFDSSIQESRDLISGDVLSNEAHLNNNLINQADDLACSSQGDVNIPHTCVNSQESEDTEAADITCTMVASAADIEAKVSSDSCVLPSDKVSLLHSLNLVESASTESLDKVSLLESLNLKKTDSEKSMVETCVSGKIDGIEKSTEIRTRSSEADLSQILETPRELSFSSDQQEKTSTDVSRNESDEDPLPKVVEVKTEACLSNEYLLAASEDSRADPVSSFNYAGKEGIIPILDDKALESDTKPPVVNISCPLCREALSESLEEHILKEHVCVSYIPAKETASYRNHMIPRVSDAVEKIAKCSDEEPRAYVCRTCEFSSKDINAVRFHLNRHEDVYQVRIGRNSCNCHQKTYSYQFHRWKQIIHSSEYFCQDCKYYFACESGFVNHLFALHCAQSLCKLCNEKVSLDNVLEHFDLHNAMENDDSLDDSLELQRTTRSKGNPGMILNIYDNAINYLDGKEFRLNIANKVPDKNLDRSYLTLPIKNVLEEATVPDKFKLDPSKDIRKYLQGKKDVRVDEEEINESLKNFNWLVQMHMERKSSCSTPKKKPSSSERKFKKENVLLDTLGIAPAKIPKSHKKEQLSVVETRPPKLKVSDKKPDVLLEGTETEASSLTRTRSGMQPLREEGEVDFLDTSALTEAIAYERNLEINGEWSKEHTYVCCSCGAGYLDLADIMDHKWEHHPSVWCAHTMFQTQQSVPLSFCLQFQPPTKQPLKVPLPTDVPKEEKAGPSKEPQGPTDSKVKAENNTKEADGDRKCSRCNLGFSETEIFHSHLVECGGLNQMIYVKKKSKKGFRFKRRKGQGVPNNRYGLSSNPSTPLKAKGGDRSSGLNTPLLEKSQSNAIQSCGVKRRLELAIGSINNNELKSRLKAIISGSKKGSSSSALGIPGRRTIKMKLRKKEVDNKLLRKTRHSDKPKDPKEKKDEEATKDQKIEEKTTPNANEVKAEVNKTEVINQSSKKGSQKKSNVMKEGEEQSNKSEASKSKSKITSRQSGGGKKAISINDTPTQNSGTTDSTSSTDAQKKSKSNKKTSKKLPLEKNVNGLIKASKQNSVISDVKPSDLGSSDMKSVDVKKVLAKKILDKKKKGSDDVPPGTVGKDTAVGNTSNVTANRAISVQKNPKQGSKLKQLKGIEASDSATAQTEKTNKKSKVIQAIKNKKDLVKKQLMTSKSSISSIPSDKAHKKTTKKGHQVMHNMKSVKSSADTLADTTVPKKLPQKKTSEMQPKVEQVEPFEKTKILAKNEISEMTPAPKKKFNSPSSSEEIEDDSEDSEPEVIRNFRSGRSCTGRAGLRNKRRPVLSRYSFRTCPNPVKKETEGDSGSEEEKNVEEQNLEKAEHDLSILSESSDLNSLSNKRKKKIANYENQDDYAYIPEENSSDSEDEDYEENTNSSIKLRKFTSSKKRKVMLPSITDEEATIPADLQAIDLGEEAHSGLPLPAPTETKISKGKKTVNYVKMKVFSSKVSKKKQIIKGKIDIAEAALLDKDDTGPSNIIETSSKNVVESQRPDKPVLKSKGKKNKGKVIATSNSDSANVLEEVKPPKTTKKKTIPVKGKVSLTSKEQKNISLKLGRTRAAKSPVKRMGDSKQPVQKDIKKSGKKCLMNSSKGKDILASEAVDPLNTLPSAKKPQKIQGRSRSITLGNVLREDSKDKKAPKTIKKSSSLSSIPQNSNKDSTAKETKKELSVNSRTLSDSNIADSSEVIPNLGDTTSAESSVALIGTLTKMKDKQNKSVRPTSIPSTKSQLSKKGASKKKNKVPLSTVLNDNIPTSQNIPNFSKSSGKANKAPNSKLPKLPAVKKNIKPSRVTSKQNVKQVNISKVTTELHPSDSIESDDVIVSSLGKRGSKRKIDQVVPVKDAEETQVQEIPELSPNPSTKSATLTEAISTSRAATSKPKRKCTKKPDTAPTGVANVQECSTPPKEESSEKSKETKASSASKKRRISVTGATDDVDSAGSLIPLKKPKRNCIISKGKLNPDFQEGSKEHQSSEVNSVLHNHIRNSSVCKGKSSKSKVQAKGSKKANLKPKVKSTKNVKDNKENRSALDSSLPIPDSSDVPNISDSDIPLSDPSKNNMEAPVSARVKRRRSSLEQVKDIPTRSTVGADSQATCSLPPLDAVTDEKNMSQVLIGSSDESSTSVVSEITKTPQLRKRRTQSSHEIKMKEETLGESCDNLDSSAVKSFKTLKVIDDHCNEEPKTPIGRKRAASISSLPKKENNDKLDSGPVTERIEKKSVKSLSKQVENKTQDKTKKNNPQKKKNLGSGKKDAKDLKCLDCGLRFDSMASLEDHRQDCITIAFEMSLMEAEDHLFECQHCHLTFAMKGTHKQHTASCRLSKYKRPLQKQDAKARRRMSSRTAGDTQEALSPVADPTLENYILEECVLKDSKADAAEVKLNVEGKLVSDPVGSCILNDNPISPRSVSKFKALAESQSIASCSKSESDQNSKVSPKCRRRLRTNGKVEHDDVVDSVPSDIASEEKCIVCGCEIRDGDMSNKHLLLEQFAHSCQQQPVLEVCVLLAYYNLSMETIRSLAGSAIIYQGTTILKLDAKQQTPPDLDPCLSTNENKYVSQLMEILASPHCMWVSSVLEAIAQQYYTVEAVSISGTRQETLGAITFLEDLFEEISNIDSTIRKNQMLRTMKETFEAGTL